MKKKVLATLVSAALVSSLLVGCGSTSTGDTTAAATTAAAAAATSAAATDTAAAATSAAATEATAASNDLLTGTEFEGVTAKEAYNFSVIVKSFQSTYWQAAITGMDMAKEELGITYDAQGPNSESDIADQVNMLNSAISAKPAGIALAACDTKSVLDSLQSAK
ncbi:MAG: substrate-binding domain-containing protein, partial [Lachnospiraceae bacterium]